MAAGNRVGLKAKVVVRVHSRGGDKQGGFGCGRGCEEVKQSFGDQMVRADLCVFKASWLIRARS